MYGASPIAESVLAEAVRTLPCGFIQGYGLTETVGAVIQLLADDHDLAGPTPIGCARRAGRWKGSRCASSSR